MKKIFDNEYEADELKKNFSVFRSELDKVLDGRDWEDKFFLFLDKLIDKSSKGDVSAQDFIGYLYKRGISGCIKASTRTYMEWTLLAGANGNRLSVDRLKIFMIPAHNHIFIEPDFEQIAKQNDLFLENYEYVLGRLFCEAMVDNLKLDLLKMIKKLMQKEQAEADEITEMRVFEKVRDMVIPDILKFLRS